MTPLDYFFLWFTIVWTFGMCLIIVIISVRDLKSREEFLREFSEKVEELRNIK